MQGWSPKHPMIDFVVKTRPIWAKVHYRSWVRPPRTTIGQITDPFALVAPEPISIIGPV